MERWAQWLAENFHKPGNAIEKINIGKITETQWDEIETYIQSTQTTGQSAKDATQKQRQSRKKRPLATSRKDYKTSEVPRHWGNTIKKQLEKWHTQGYTQQEIRRTMQTRRRNKAHGNDGGVEDVYRTIAPWVAKPPETLLKKIKNGQESPDRWKEGAIVHIYKGQGHGAQCEVYRPISPPPGNIQNTPQPTSEQNQENTTYSYQRQPIWIQRRTPRNRRNHEKSNIAKKTPNNSHGILLLDLTRAFGTVIRTTLWAARYMKGFQIKIYYA